MRFKSPILGFVAAASLAVSAGSSWATPPAGKPTTTGKPASAGKPVTTGKPTASTTRTTGKPTVTGKPTKSTSGKPAGTKSGSTSTPTTPTTTGSGSTSTNTGSTSTSTGSTSTNTGSTSTTTPLNPIAAKIASKPNLNTKISGMLPTLADGSKMSLNQASLGFKNQGQFIAALHVSQNLGVSFTELKSHMVTVTPGVGGAQPTATQTGSLGQAIQAVKKTANATTETERAETQANADLRTTGTSTTTTSTSTSSPTKTKKKTTQAGAQ